MKSLNVKRIAAIAAGAAMIGSLAAPGLAVTTNPSTDAVNTLVGSIKGHLDDVQVVLGSKGADIVDGISAAKIAAALAQADFTAGASGGTIEGIDQLTVTDKSVAVRTSSTPAQISRDVYDITYSGQAANTAMSSGTANFFATRGPSTGTQLQFLAPGSLGNVLSVGSVSAQYGATQATSTYTTWTFREELNITNSNVSYGENDFPPVVGHGLYWNASDTNLRYSIVFDTQLPTDTNYLTIPKINFLGYNFAIDYRSMNRTTFPDLYTGKAWIAAAGDKFSEFAGYEIEFVGATVITGNTIAANVKVTRKSDGAVEQRTDLQDGVGWPFFANPSTGIGEITVYVERVGATPSTLQSVVGRGQVRVRPGQDFTLDKRWYVPTQGVDVVTDSGLRFFSFVYGNRSASSSDPEGRGNFRGSPVNGLKAGYVLNGPLRADGTAKFTVTLRGFGGTRTVDTADLWFGTNNGIAGTSNLPTINAKWRDRDGLMNYLSHQNPFQVNFTATNNSSIDYANDGAGAGDIINYINMSVGGAVYTVVNDKVLYLDSIEATGTSNYSINFYVGGNPSLNPEAYRVTAGPIPAAGSVVGLDANNTTLTVGGVSGFTCTVQLMSTSSVAVLQNGSTCNLHPSQVRFGAATVVDSRVQSMDLMGIGHGAYWRTNRPSPTLQGDWSLGGIAYTSLAGVGNNLNMMPFVRVFENTSISQTAILGPFNYSLVLDANSTNNQAGSAETTPRYGFGVYDTTIIQNTNGSVDDPLLLTLGGAGSWAGSTALINLSRNSTSSPLLAQNVDPSAFLESLKYHTDAFGAEFDGSTLGEVKVVHPEDQRDAVVRLAAAVPAGTNQSIETVLREGGELSGVKVVRIDGKVGGTENLRVSGAAGTTLYTKGGKLGASKVKNLIVMDTGASATYKIVVGGPWVNKLAEAMSAPEALTQAAGNSFLHQEGNSLLVAGYTGSDTAAAADMLVDLLMP
ncbi:hypothetical protein HYS54_04595 [Candidatus Micrarchaeota archaeon]|nr:hypothetical protein [Candidatus Micrarchaeota archaeon]